MSVSAASSVSKDADHSSDQVHGKILGTMSVSGFIQEKKTPNLN